MHLLTTIAIGFVLVVASAHLTRLALKFALRRNLLDLPNERSSHSSPKPRAGGFSIVCVILLAVTGLTILHMVSPLASAGLALGGLIALVGGWDDFVSLPIMARFAVQAFACTGAVLTLLTYHQARRMAGDAIFAVVLLVVASLALVWLVNLTNFMDGIDGLAGTEAVTVGAVCCVLSLASHGTNSPAILFGVLAAAALGFLLWNWYPAVIFMGDIGSGFLGFCFGALAILAAVQHVLPVFVPVILLGVFIVDATYTLLRRMSSGERWYTPHRSHA